MEDDQSSHTVAEIEVLVSILILGLPILFPRRRAWGKSVFLGVKSKDFESIYSFFFLLNETTDYGREKD